MVNLPAERESSIIASVVDQFGGGRRKRLFDAPTAPPPLDQRELHPAAVEAAANYSNAIRIAEQLRQDLAHCQSEHHHEVTELRAQLDAERRLNEELRRLLDQERRMKEQYQRYSVEIQTHLSHVVDAATRANNVAMSAAHDAAEPPAEPQPLSEVNAIDEAREHERQLLEKMEREIRSS